MGDEQKVRWSREGKLFRWGIGFKYKDIARGKEGLKRDALCDSNEDNIAASPGIAAMRPSRKEESAPNPRLG